MKKLKRILALFTIILILIVFYRYSYGRVFSRNDVIQTSSNILGIEEPISNIAWHLVLDGGSRRYAFTDANNQPYVFYITVFSDNSIVSHLECSFYEYMYMGGHPAFEDAQGLPYKGEAEKELYAVFCRWAKSNPCPDLSPETIVDAEVRSGTLYSGHYIVNELDDRFLFW